MPAFIDTISPVEKDELPRLGNIDPIGSGHDTDGDFRRLLHIRRQLTVAPDLVESHPVRVTFNVKNEVPTRGPAMLDHQLDDERSEVFQRAAILWDAPDALDVTPTRQAFLPPQGQGRETAQPQGQGRETAQPQEPSAFQ